MNAPELANRAEAIVGLSGNAACGKDTVAAVFEEYGFHHQSASDIVREEIGDLGLEPTRELQTQTANRIRHERGENYFVRAAIARLKDAGHNLIVVSGIYAPCEGEYMRGLGGYLVEVASMPSDTPEAQFERISNRSSGTRDDISYNEFMEAVKRENNGTRSLEANVGMLSNMSDFKVVHDGDPATIRPQVRTILEEIL